MEAVDKLINNNKITIYVSGQFSEPLIKTEKEEIMLLTDYLFYKHSYKDTVIQIKSHLNDQWLNIAVNHHIQKLRENEINDVDLYSSNMKIKLEPIEILDEIINELNTYFRRTEVGNLLNILDDYSMYIEFLINENMSDYDVKEELLFIEKENEEGHTEYHHLTLEHNQLRRNNQEIIDISWFIHSVGIDMNELKRMKNINTQYL